MSTTPRSKSISAARIGIVLLTLLGLPALSVLGIRFLLPPPRWLLPQDRFSADQAVALGLAVAETFPFLCVYQLLLRRTCFSVVASDLNALHLAFSLPHLSRFFHTSSFSPSRSVHDRPPQAFIQRAA